MLDYHLHSTCSADSISTIAQYCRHAAERLVRFSYINVDSRAFGRGGAGEDTEGIEARFGDDQAMVETVRLIGERRGIGDLLALSMKKTYDQIRTIGNEQGVAPPSILKGDKREWHDSAD